MVIGMPSTDSSEFRMEESVNNTTWRFSRKIVLIAKDF